jgi:hypothetical protein
METPGTDPITSQATGTPRRKLWHGIFFGLGCSVLTLGISFLCLSAVVIGSTFAFFLANESFLTSLSSDEVLRGEKWILALIVGASLLLALIAGILGGRTVFRRSADPQATRRLFSSILAGLGFGILFLVLGVIAGILIDGAIFLPLDYSFGESAFSLVILIPTLTGIFAGLIGIILGTLFVFRILRPKNKTTGAA